MYSPCTGSKAGNPALGPPPVYLAVSSWEKCPGLVVRRPETRKGPVLTRLRGEDAVSSARLLSWGVVLGYRMERHDVTVTLGGIGPWGLCNMHLAGLQKAPARCSASSPVTCFSGPQAVLWTEGCPWLLEA